MVNIFRINVPPEIKLMSVKILLLKTVKLKLIKKG
jgi:hypothetical protein